MPPTPTLHPRSRRPAATAGALLALAGAAALALPAAAAPAAVEPPSGMADALLRHDLIALFAVVAGLLLHTGAAHLLHEAGEAGPIKGGAGSQSW